MRSTVGRARIVLWNVFELRRQLRCRPAARATTRVSESAHRPCQRRSTRLDTASVGLFKTRRDAAPNVGRCREVEVRVALGITIVAMLLVSVPASQAATVNRCLARKINSVGATVVKRTRCYAIAAGRGSNAGLARCTQAASSRFTDGTRLAGGAFDVAEQHPPCVTVGDESVFNDAAAVYAAAVRDALGSVDGPSRCSAIKLVCVGRYVAALARCHAKAAVSGVLDSKCLTKAVTRISDLDTGCLARAERVAEGHCALNGHPSGLAAAADNFMHDTLCALDPAGSTGCGVPLPTRTRTPTPVRTPTPISTAAGDPTQFCVDTINGLRASVGLPPYARWTEAETCVRSQAHDDGLAGRPHSSGGRCGEAAQNACFSSGTPTEAIGGCLQLMWAQGAVAVGARTEYKNMTSTTFTKVACGFEFVRGRIFTTQDFK